MIDSDEVEARLIEAERVWQWGAGAVRGYATDGPWHLYRPDFADRYDPHGEGAGRVIAQAVRMPRPDRDMIDRATVAGEWLLHVPDPADRKLVVLAIGHLARGRRVVPWGSLLRAMGVARGKMGLIRRYRRAIAAIVDALNGADARR